MTADQIITAARSQIKTPFVHQGRVPGKALDCAGLVVTVARMVGADPLDVVGYSRIPTGVLGSVMDRQTCLRRIPVDQAAPGDILVMRFKTDPQHLAILAGATIIHSHADVRQCCEHTFDDQWRRRVTAVYRFIGIEA